MAMEGKMAAVVLNVVQFMIGVAAVVVTSVVQKRGV